MTENGHGVREVQSEHFDDPRGELAVWVTANSRQAGFIIRRAKVCPATSAGVTTSKGSGASTPASTRFGCSRITSRHAV